MIAETNRLKELGYNFAIKGWADGKPTEDFFVMAWQRGKVKETAKAKHGKDPVVLLNEILQDVDPSYVPF